MQAAKSRRSRRASFSTYAVLGALCLTACLAEDAGGDGTGTGSRNKGGAGGSSGLNVGGRPR